MPRKPRTQAKKYRRRAREVHIANLIEIRDDLQEYIVFLSGESESSNELAAYATAMMQAIQEIIEAYQEHIINKM